MIYEFQNTETGTFVEIEMSPDEAPAIGEAYTDRLVRVPSVPLGAKVSRDVAHVSNQLPRVWRGEGPDPAPRRDAKGRPVFNNRRETVEYAAKTGMKYDEL